MIRGLLFPSVSWPCRAALAAAVLLAFLGRVAVGADSPAAAPKTEVEQATSASAGPAAHSVAPAPPGMVNIPPGRFRMGQKGVLHAPEKDIYLDGFYIDKYEVTNGDFKRFMDAAGYSTEAYWNHVGWLWKGLQKISAPAQWDSAAFHGGGIPGNEQFPVTGVSWWEADAYARWAGKRLPTEAEWEKAAKGGCEKYGDPNACDSLDAPEYPWPGVWNIHRANSRSSGDPYEKDGHTTAAGFYDGSAHSGYQTIDTPGPYGVYDVSGNVWEWCSTQFEPYPYDASDGREAPPATFDEESRLVRGGSWRNLFPFLRCATRDAAKPDLRFRTIGFRCAQSLPK
jgi:gamma-glutamyl hercynylcysteine S-oxide synthase